MNTVTTRTFDTRSEAKKAQANHWETLGQLASMYHLCQYILGKNKYLDINVQMDIQSAADYLYSARQYELRNNQFIDLSLPRGF